MSTTFVVPPLIGLLMAICVYLGFEIAKTIYKNRIEELKEKLEEMKSSQATPDDETTTSEK